MAQARERCRRGAGVRTHDRLPVRQSAFDRIASGPGQVDKDATGTIRISNPTGACASRRQVVGQVVPERFFGEGVTIPAPIMQQAVLMDSHARFDATLMDKDVEPEEIRLLAARLDMTKGGTGGSVVSPQLDGPTTDEVAIVVAPTLVVGAGLDPRSEACDRGDKDAAVLGGMEGHMQAGISPSTQDPIGCTLEPAPHGPIEDQEGSGGSVGISAQANSLGELVPMIGTDAQTGGDKGAPGQVASMQEFEAAQLIPHVNSDMQNVELACNGGMKPQEGAAFRKLKWFCNALVRKLAPPLLQEVQSSLRPEAEPFMP